MSAEDKVSELFCIANDFRKIFDASMQVHHKKELKNRAILVRKGDFDFIVSNVQKISSAESAVKRI